MADENPVLITISDMAQSVTIHADGAQVVTWQAPEPPQPGEQE